MVIAIKIIVSICIKLSYLSPCKQSTSSLTPFLRHCKETSWGKLAIFGNLGIPDNIHLKEYYQFEETFDNFLQAKINLIFTFLWDIAKILRTCCFGYFRYAWLCTPRVIISPCRKLSYLPAGKKNQLHPPCFSGDIAKILQIYCFGYFGYAWLYIQPKVILSTCRKLSCLSAGKKSTSSLMFFWRCCKDMQISYFGYFGYTHPIW